LSNQKDIIDGAFLTKAVVISVVINNACGDFVYRNE
jgi:hypothetical protein